MQKNKLALVMLVSFLFFFSLLFPVEASENESLEVGLVLTGPTINSTVPANNTEDVSINTVLSVYFSENMNMSTINSSTFMLMKGSTKIPGSISFNNQIFKAEFDPEDALSYSTVYTVKLSNEIKSEHNVNLASNYTWFFETESEPSGPLDEGAAGGGWVGGAPSAEEPECVENSDCSKNEYCIDNHCVVVFDVDILRVDSPIVPGDFLDFTYYIKEMGEISGDVFVKFWLESKGVKYSEGMSTIYLGTFDKITKTGEIYLPHDLPLGEYTFHIQVEFEKYLAESTRTVEVKKTVPSVLDIRIPDIPERTSDEPLKFSIIISSNKDSPLTVNLTETVEKDSSVVWEAHKNIVLERSVTINESVKGLGAGTYLVKASAEHYEGIISTSKVAKIKWGRKEQKFYAGILILILTALLIFVIFYKRRKSIAREFEEELIEHRGLIEVIIILLLIILSIFVAYEWIITPEKIKIWLSGLSVWLRNLF
ncbi:MAG: Ig-like domain-containing protein [Candidatus Undinarchaeales archaeon]